MRSMVKRIILKTVKEFGKLLSKHKDFWLTKVFVNISDVLLRNIENVNFNQKQNGEERLLNKLSVLNFKTIFDIGANVGEWALFANQFWPKSTIHCFEILPTHITILKNNTKVLKNIIVNEYGLSDIECEIEVFYNDKLNSDVSATIYPQFYMQSERNHYTAKSMCKVHLGLDYLKEKNISLIDFLKVDVEGNDLNVLKGFGNNLLNIRIIQFEYGVYNITSRNLLIDFYKLLEEYGFIIGRLYPQKVDFFKYDYFKENFYGGNYIAIKKTDTQLIDILSKF